MLFRGISSADGIGPAMSDSSRAVEPRRNICSQAAALAARTPASRNRYVDFLRAVSIGAVVTGHWLVAAPYVSGGQRGRCG